MAKANVVETWSLLATLALGCASTAGRAPSPRPEYPPLRTDAQVEAQLPRLTNWGRWGPDDVRGTLKGWSATPLPSTPWGFPTWACRSWTGRNWTR